MNSKFQKDIMNFKVVLLGESSVGKSSLVLRFCKGQFLESGTSTIGAAFQTQSVYLDQNIIRFEIWDTAGQERYRALAPMYYRGASVAIVVYDITNMDSFEKAKSWVIELKSHIRRSQDQVLVFLVGNKNDLENQRTVSQEMASSYADENNLYFHETSAKTASQVNELFVEIARKVSNLPQVEIRPKIVISPKVQKPSPLRSRYCSC